MKKFLFLFFVGTVTTVFFYKTIFKGLIPFPGDLLIAEYQPWKSYSFLGYNPGSYPNKKQYFDTIRQIYPWRTLVNQELKKGNLPLWNPYNFSGHPLLANLQSQVFYPLTFLYFVFSQPTAWTILIILQPLLASMGMNWYLQQMKKSHLAACLGAISYGFSLFMTVFLEYNTIGHVILWLPYILLAIELIYSSPKIYSRIFFVFFLVASILAGHLQIFGAILLFIITYAAILRRKIVREIIILTIISLGIASIQLLPTLELLSHSARANHDYQDLITRLLIQPKQLFTFINPDIFGNPATGNYSLNDSYPGKALFFGSFPFFFSLIGFFAKKRDKIRIFFSVVSFLLLVFITNNPISKFMYYFPLPLISQSAPGNYLFLLVFCGSVLAAYGLDFWMIGERIKLPLIITTVLVGGIIIVGTNKSMIFMAVGVFGILCFIFFLSRFAVNKKIAVIFIICLTLGELWYSFQKFNPFVPTELIYPNTPIISYLHTLASNERVLGYGAGQIDSNYATQLSLFDPNGYDPLYPRDYGAFIYSSKEGKFPTIFDKSIRSDARIAEGFGKEPYDNNLYRKNIIDLLGVKYIINKEENGTTEETFPPLTYPVIYRQDGFIIHENLTTKPRAFFTTATASAQITNYEPSYLQIRVSTPITQSLIVSDTYMPGWEAFIDNSATSIEKVYTTLRAITVPEGEHTVTFRYKPKSFTYGVNLTIINTISLLIYLFWWRIIRKKL